MSSGSAGSGPIRSHLQSPVIPGFTLDKRQPVARCHRLELIEDGRTWADKGHFSPQHIERIVGAHPRAAVSGRTGPTLVSARDLGDLVRQLPFTSDGPGLDVSAAMNRLTVAIWIRGSLPGVRHGTVLQRYKIRA